MLRIDKRKAVALGSSFVHTRVHVHVTADVKWRLSAYAHTLVLKVPESGLKDLLNPNQSQLPLRIGLWVIIEGFFRQMLVVPIIVELDF